MAWLCAENFADWGSTLGVHQRRVKAKADHEIKSRVFRKAEKFVWRKGVREVGGKSEYVFARSHANNLAKKENQTGDPGSIYTEKS